ncbi:MAG: clan AA aspartic protease [Planctomycetota bacterium]
MVLVRRVAQRGEIRVDVRLTNAIDEGVVRRGEMEVDSVRTIATDAMVGTGAIRSCISPAIAEHLGVQVVEHFDVELANGESTTVGLTEPIRFELLGRSTMESAIVLGNEVLLGQTILETTELLADCANQRLIPNPAHPDGPVLKVKAVRPR